jgi:hypothetical protein
VIFLVAVSLAEVVFLVAVSLAEVIFVFSIDHFVFACSVR